MLHRLGKNDYEKVRPLFQGLSYQLITTAVLAGTSPGVAWADDSARPRTAFLASPEGCFLAGDPGNHALNRALNALIVGDILARNRAIAVIPDPDTWQAQIDRVLAGCRFFQEERRHYQLDRLQVDRSAALPAGYALAPIDAGLLNSAGLAIPEQIHSWIENNWESRDRFLRDGFGFCTVHGDRIVSWSLADCVAGDACEIGIQTAEDHRRRGLATCTAAAMVEQALAHGLSQVGWHCNEDNAGSQGVAEKVGFVLERHYRHYLCLA